MEQEAISLYRELAKRPTLKSAQIAEVNDTVVTVDSVWTQRCLERYDSHQFSQAYTLNKHDLKLVSKSKPNTVAECIWSVSSPSGNKNAVVKKHVPDKTKPSEERWYFEIWSKAGYCESVFNVTSCEKHGVIYGEDGAFGSLTWSPNEDKLAYVAERKAVKSVSYFEETKKGTAERDRPVAGNKFAHKEDWGEMLVDKEQAVICVLDLTSGEVSVIEHEALSDTSCGQVVWCPKENALVFCALPHQTTRLGVIHCPVRLSILYYYSLDSQILKSLNDADNLCVRSPRFSPDGSMLVYLQCQAGGAHCKGMKLKLMNWETRDSKVLVDTVKSASSDAHFHGIYLVFLANKCWHTKGTHVFFSTPCRSRKDVFSVNVVNGEVERITSVFGSWTVKDVGEGYILAALSTIDTPCRLAIGSLDELDSGTGVSWRYLDEANSISGISWEVMEHKPLIPHPEYDQLTYDSIIVRPVDQESKGLVMFAHGGPHSVISPGYQLYFVLLVKHGFTISLVNYRGSTGYGEDSINSLVGHIGDIDIKDVQQSAEEVLEKHNMDRNKVVVLGGSHGGFVAAHLIGQYPDFYKAAVIRNPVTNLVTKVALTDIPDWAHVEVGWDAYIPCSVPDAQLYSLLYSMSPVAHISKVKTPTMVMLGEVDRRVPPSQGIEFHKALKAKGVHTKLFVYPDNSHPIVTVEAESDSIINLYMWFVEHLKD